jgi:hypothetical protein
VGEEPEVIRRRIERTRDEMGETLDAIAYRLDVKSRAKEKMADTVDRTKESISETTTSLKEAVGGAAATIRDAATRGGREPD